MNSLVDTHCHLLAGLDDGPKDMEEAWELCRIAWHDGVRVVAATAHQNPQWPLATAERIRSSTEALRDTLAEAQIPLEVHPCGEVMIGPELLDDWHSGRLVSIGDMGRYLLIEMPHTVFLDIRGLAAELMDAGLRPILAHPERYYDLWYQPEMMVDLIRSGCLMQVCATGVLSPDPRTQRQLRFWLESDWVHLVASDGHSVGGRRPELAAAFERVASWTNAAVAERLFSANGLAVMQGQSLEVPEPRLRPRKRRWFFWASR